MGKLAGPGGRLKWSLVENVETVKKMQESCPVCWMVCCMGPDHATCEKDKTFPHSRAERYFAQFHSTDTMHRG